MAWLCEEAEQQPVYCAWEDLHWADPSTLELLTLFLDQVPTTRLLAVLTFRPEFTPPWGSAFVSQSAHAQSLRTAAGRSDGREGHGRQSAAAQRCVQQIVSKTDGVPLFVEELTKMVVESG